MKHSFNLFDSVDCNLVVEHLQEDHSFHNTVTCWARASILLWERKIPTDKNFSTSTDEQAQDENVNNR